MVGIKTMSWAMVAINVCAGCIAVIMHVWHMNGGVTWCTPYVLHVIQVASVACGYALYRTNN